MDKRNFLDFRQRLQLTVILTLFAASAFAQNNLKPTALVSISDKNPDKTTFERPRVIEAKPEKSPAKTVQFSAEFEQKAFKILNNIRVENGLTQLVWSEDMAKVARLHSENMATFKFFSHTGKDGFSVNDRADSLGFYKWEALGENIAYNRGYEKPVEKACDGWMQSNGHRSNVLNRIWKEAAVGVAIAEDGTVYFTNVFVAR